VLFVRYSVA